LITWIIARVNEENPEPKVISGTLMLISVVAQSTTSVVSIPMQHIATPCPLSDFTPQSLGHALFWLVSRPECIEILREEIMEAIMLERELTFESLARMPKLESFIRETQRLSGIGSGQ
jgi:Cytochrome P450